MDSMELVPLLDMLNQRTQSSKLSLSAQSFTIPDGSMVGEVVIRFVPRTEFRILDLPAEVRNRIYSHVFTREKSIRLTMYVIRANVVKVVEWGFLDKTKHKGLEWDKATAKWLKASPSAFALLLASKQINQEATPIAYGSNCFEMEPKVLPHWRKVTMKNFKHINSVELTHIPSTMANAQRTFLQLASCTSIRTVRISNVSWLQDNLAMLAERHSHSAKARRLWGLVGTFLLTCQDNYQARGRTWKALDTVQLVIDPTDSSRARRELGKLEDAFREVANGYLKEE